MEELMASRAAVLAVLGYLFARFDERFDGAPTLLILDEAWLFLDDPVFAARIRQWLKTLRKKNVSVNFSTQSLADIKDSSIAPALIESCASRVFLARPQATEPQIRTISEAHMSELLSLMRISYAAFSLKKTHTNTHLQRT